MSTSPSTLLLNAPRRWALRELKLHPGHTVVVAGAPVAWTIELIRELVTDTGKVFVVDGDPRRADRIASRINRRAWINVRVLIGLTGAGELPGRADRVFLDDQRLIADAGLAARILAPLGSAGRVAAVCTRGAAGTTTRALEDQRLHSVRRERFYLGAAHALWGQVP